ncbi:putative reverse transcriptase domain-containing protein [Tanacetum coccineum]
MDDPNITMEEYIRLDEEKARKRGKVFNWETTKYGKICSLNDEIDFIISFDDSDDEDYTVIFDKNSFSYKIISVNNMKMDSENNNEKVNMPSFPSFEPTVSCFNDLDFFKDFENEFPAIVYNDAPTSKLDLLTEPTLNPQHIDEFDLKYETSLSECDEKEQNVLYFNDLFPFDVIYPDDSKSDKDNDDDKINFKQSSGGMLLNLIKNLYVSFSIPFDPKLFYKDGIKLGLSIQRIQTPWIRRIDLLDVIQSLFFSTVDTACSLNEYSVFNTGINMAYPGLCWHSDAFTISRQDSEISKGIGAESASMYWMDDLNVTIEEYIRLEEEKAQKRGKVFNWETTKYGKIWYNEDIHDLRYQGLDYTDADIADFEERLERIHDRDTHRVQVVDFQVFTSQAWRRLFDIRGPLVGELILEFLSTLKFGELLLDLDAPGTIQFQLGRARRCMSWRQFIVALGLHAGEEMESLGFARYWSESERMIPGKGDLCDYWRSISIDGDFLGPLPSYTLIRDPGCLRLSIGYGHSIAGRSQAPEKGLISSRKFVPRLAEHFGVLTEERLQGLTVIMRELLVIDMAELVRLQICEEIDDTWAWVALGPERQPDATAGAPRAAEDDPGVDEGHMPQRLGRLEEEVQGLRQDVRTLRGLVERSMTDQRRFSTWMISCMTQLMEASGQTYQAFDGTFRGSSLQILGVVPGQMTNGASTSVLPGNSLGKDATAFISIFLRDQASNWLERFLMGSISTWEDLTTRFFAQFFPPGRTTKLRNDILMFQQHQENDKGIESNEVVDKNDVEPIELGDKKDEMDDESDNESNGSVKEE